MNKENNRPKGRRYVAAAVAALVMALLMVGSIWLMLWVFEADPIGAPPLPLLALLILLPATVIVGVGLALWQRLREIRRGEEDDAAQY